MEIVLRSQKKDKIETIVSIVGVENTTEIPEDGIDGSTVSYIIELTKNIIEIGANLSVIAGLIYKIVNDNKYGKAIINGKLFNKEKAKKKLLMI